MSDVYRCARTYEWTETNVLSESAVLATCGVEYLRQVIKYVRVWSVCDKRRLISRASAGMRTPSRVHCAG